jgi:hypothetical protein
LRVKLSLTTSEINQAIADYVKARTNVSVMPSDVRIQVATVQDGVETIWGEAEHLRSEFEARVR